MIIKDLKTCKTPKSSKVGLRILFATSGGFGISLNVVIFCHVEKLYPQKFSKVESRKCVFYLNMTH